MWRVARSRFELKQVRCFVVVAEELNFRRAAGAVHMDNIRCRDIDTPDHFHSTPYLTAGPKRRGTKLYQGMKDRILTVLEPFR